MSSNKLPRLHEALTKLLAVKLKKFSDANTSLNRSTCIEIYTTIFDTIVEIIAEGQINITNEAVNYLAQQYYDCIVINQTHELDPNIFDKRAKLEEIETKEIALLAMMLNHTPLAVPLIHEIKKRS